MLHHRISFVRRTITIALALVAGVAGVAALAANTATAVTSRSAIANACTGPVDSTHIPKSVNVLLTDYNGFPKQVVTVDFFSYVANVLSNEWAPRDFEPTYKYFESLKAGAIAIKTWTWHFMRTREKGANFGGLCFDVADWPYSPCPDGELYGSGCSPHWYSSAQVYDPFNVHPNVHSTFQEALDATTATWSTVAHEDNDVFDAEYRSALVNPKVYDRCDDGIGGSTWLKYQYHVLSQSGADDCAVSELMSAASILQRYYPGIRLFDPSTQPPSVPLVTTPLNNNQASYNSSFQLSGSGLAGATVYVDNVAAPTQVQSDSQLTFQVPHIPGINAPSVFRSFQSTLSVSVTDPYGQSTSAGTLSVESFGNCTLNPTTCPGTIWLDPDHGPKKGGTLVTIHGDNMAAINRVYFGLCKDNCIPLKDGKIHHITLPSGEKVVQVTSPPWPDGIGDVPIEVTNQGGPSKNDADYHYDPNPPHIDTMTPNKTTSCYAPRVRITGSFYGTIQSVTFGGQAATIVRRRLGRIVVVPPLLTGKVAVVITTKWGSNPPKYFSFNGTGCTRTCASGDGHPYVGIDDSVPGTASIYSTCGVGTQSLSVSDDGTHVYVTENDPGSGPLKPPDGNWTKDKNSNMLISTPLNGALRYSALDVDVEASPGAANVASINTPDLDVTASASRGVNTVNVTAAKSADVETGASSPSNISAHATGDVSVTTGADGGTAPTNVNVDTGLGAINVQGSDGDDTITTSGGVSTTVDAGDGTNTMTIESNTSATITGGSGVDNITFPNAVGNVVAIDAGDGNNNVNVAGAATSLSVQTGSGDDSITTNASTPTTINAGDGKNNVTVTNATPSASVTTGSGNDSVNVNSPRANVSVLLGDGDHNNATVAGLFPGYQSNVVGGAGNDLISVAEGAAFLDGGAGTNTVSYASQLTPVVADLAHNPMLRNFQNVIGGQGHNVLIGSDAPNILWGGPKNDVFEGGGGNDLIVGGGGNDWVSYADHTSKVNVAIKGNTTTTGNGSAGESDSLTGISAIEGSPNNDTLTGTAPNETFRGGAGDDTITGSGNNDTVDYSDHSDAVHVTLAQPGGPPSVGNGSGTENDSIIGIDNVIGGSGDDTLTGNRNNNTLTGGPGSDTLNSGGGSDTASYADHNIGIDVTLNDSGPGIEHGADGETDTIGADIERVTGGLGDDTIRGNKNTNVLLGGDGKDTLVGNGGGDWLDGGNGDDHLYADAGPDATISDNGFYILTAGRQYLPSVVLGGDGSDTIDAANGVVDTIDCGGDVDQLYLDDSEYAVDSVANDAHQAPTCEHQTRVGWGTWKAVPLSGEAVIAKPASASPSAGVTDLFYRSGSTYTIRYARFDGAVWQPSADLGAPPKTQELDGDVAASASGSGGEQVATVEYNGTVSPPDPHQFNVWTRWRPSPNAAWSPAWGNLGAPPAGINGTGIAMASVGPVGSVAIFVMGADNYVWGHAYLNAVGWTNWFRASTATAYGGLSATLSNATSSTISGITIASYSNSNQGGRTLIENGLLCTTTTCAAWPSTDYGCLYFDIYFPLCDIWPDAPSVTSTSPGWTTSFVTDIYEQDIYEIVQHPNGTRSDFMKVAPVRVALGDVPAEVFGTTASSAAPTTIQLFAKDASDHLHETDFNPRPPNAG